MLWLLKETASWYHNERLWLLNGIGYHNDWPWLLKETASWYHNERLWLLNGIGYHNDWPWLLKETASWYHNERLWLLNGIGYHNDWPWLLKETASWYQMRDCAMGLGHGIIMKYHGYSVHFDNGTPKTIWIEKAAHCPNSLFFAIRIPPIVCCDNFNSHKLPHIAI